MSGLDPSPDDPVSAAEALRAIDETDRHLQEAVRRGDADNLFLRSRWATVLFGGALPVLAGVGSVHLWVAYVALALGLIAAVAEQRRFRRAAGVRVSPMKRAELRGDRSPARLRRDVRVVIAIFGAMCGILISEIPPPLWVWLAAAPFTAAACGRSWDRERRRRLEAA